ncbi:acetylornithine aminotransferase [Thecaphora frezii]|nr:putative acetylornithine aminotransferase precursor [Thecaphora frezii]
MAYRLTTAGASLSRRLLLAPHHHNHALLPAARCLATPSRAPCSDYLRPTHPDGDASQGSHIANTLERFQASVLATYSRPQLLFTRGSGLDLYSAADPNSNNGAAERKYLDFSSGIAVNSLGHADPQIAKLAGEQSARLVHASNLYHNEWSGELADRMVKLTHQRGGLGFAKGSQPADPHNTGLKVFLANSGTEANEAALKFARKAAKHQHGADKTGLVCFHNAFHGRTMGALAVTPNPKYQAPFAPLVGDIAVGHYNSLDGLDTLITEKTAGVIVEPVQGEGGIYPAKLEFLQALRRRCDQVGTMLIFDEIQCGLFRSGTLWCHSELPTDAHPDMVTMAKPLANGFPIGAVLMRDRVAQAIAVGDHGTTFGGGPLTSAIAHHVLGRLASPELGESMRASSRALVARLEEVRDLFSDLVRHEPESGRASPRGKGLLLGMSMKEPSHAGRVVALARQRGLLILTAGNDTVRILPSLTVTREQVDRAVDVIESCLLVLRDEVKRESSSGSASSSSSVVGGQQQRGFSTSARALAQRRTTLDGTQPLATTAEVQAVYHGFLELGSSWPHDALRPELSFGKSIQEAAQRGLLTVQSQSAISEHQIGATDPEKVGVREMTVEELDYAKKALEALRQLRDGEVEQQWSLPESIKRPASNPQYYEKLANALERAGQGKKVEQGWGEWVKRFFGRS